MYFNLCIVVFVITEYLSSRCQFSSFLINWNFRSYLICKYSPWNEKVQGFLKHQFIQMKSTLDVTVKHSATLNYTLVFMSVAVGTSLIISSSNWRIFFFFQLLILSEQDYELYYCILIGVWTCEVVSDVSSGLAWG